MMASFNRKPPIPKGKAHTWDVNILLKYLINLGPSENITDMKILAGKMLLLVMLSQMCRSSEVVQFKLSNMFVGTGYVTFTHPNPVKTFNPKTLGQVQRLQHITIKQFDGSPAICPLQTLAAYIKMTSTFQGSVTPIDSFFIVTSTYPPRPATRDTVV